MSGLLVTPYTAHHAQHMIAHAAYSQLCCPVLGEEDSIWQGQEEAEETGQGSSQACEEAVQLRVQAAKRGAVAFIKGRGLQRQSHAANVYRFT